MRVSLHRRGERYHLRLGDHGRGHDGRQYLAVGRITAAEAEAARRLITAAAAIESAGGSAPPQIYDELPSGTDRARAAAIVTAAARPAAETRTVGSWLAAGLAWRSAPVYRHAAAAVAAYFGEDRRLETITPADFDDLWPAVHRAGGATGGPLAISTARRRCHAIAGLVRRGERLGLFADAGRLLAHLPPAAMPHQADEADRRRQWIPAADVRRAIDYAVDDEQRLIFALGRWGGLRIPSEALPLTWADCDWSAELLTVRSPKLAGHAGAVRTIPMWAELRELLERIYDRAEPGAAVIRRYRSPNASAHTSRLRAALRRAGLAVEWPRPWINCRSTRATELLTDWPADLVHYWIGHSAAISRRHYQQWAAFDWRGHSAISSKCEIRVDD